MEGSRTRPQDVSDTVRIPRAIAAMFARSERSISVLHSSHIRSDKYASALPHPKPSRLLCRPLAASASVPFGRLAETRNDRSALTNRSSANASSMRIGREYRYRSRQQRSVSRRNEDLAEENAELKAEIRGLKGERDDLARVFERLRKQANRREIYCGVV